jgi:uncharacterized protein YprB with RNaseH-like and TPR domain
MRICTLDLETTSLSAVGRGFILVAVVKPLDQQPIVLRYDTLGCKPGKENELVSILIDILSGFHLWIGQNICNYDFNFVKSRASILGIPFHCQPFLYDTMRAFKRLGYLTERNPKTSRPIASLDHIVDFLGIQQMKTKVGYPREHWKTVWETGEERARAMNKLVEHCIFDCDMTEKVYWKLIEVDNVWGIRRTR